MPKPSSNASHGREMAVFARLDDVHREEHIVYELGCSLEAFRGAARAHGAQSLSL